MDDKLRQEIALFRFSLIAPILNNTFQNKTVKQYLQEICAKEYESPRGLKKQYAPETIKEWLRFYKTKGIDGLYPKNRSDKGGSRKIYSELREIITKMKLANPKRSAKSIYQEIVVKNLIKPSQVSLTTVQRYVSKIDLEGEDNKKDRRAFEFKNPNDCWQSDVSVGPYLTINGLRQKTYIIAFLDDSSRLVVSCRAFATDNLISLLTVFREAVAKRGVPKKVFFDNGKIFRAGQMELICASLGSTLCFAKPYSPQSKGKIERWFQTLQKQWQHLIDTSSFSSINELNESLSSYVEEQYNHSYHSSIKSKPIDKFMESVSNIKLLSEAELKNIFLYRVTRNVKKDATISIEKRLYEVPSKYISTKLSIRYDPTNESEAYVFTQEGKRLERILPVDKIANSTIKRRSSDSTVDFSSFSNEGGV